MSPLTSLSAALCIYMFTYGYLLPWSAQVPTSPTGEVFYQAKNIKPGVPGRRSNGGTRYTADRA